MPYLIQGDEFELDLGLMQRLAAVIAESASLVLADATHRLVNSFGIVRFQERAEAERVAARFTEMGFANFVLDELLEVPRARVLGSGAEPPEERIGVVALGRLVLEERHTVRDVGRTLVGISYVPIPLPEAGAEETTITRERMCYYLDLLTREKHWRVRSGMLPRIVEVYTEVDVSGAYLSEGVRSLSRTDRGIRTFRRERDWDRYVTWLFQLRYA